MLPFNTYPYGGRKLLGKLHGTTCRRGYGLDFMKKTGQHSCAYCGRDFSQSYENWLSMALDHVVPTSVCKGWGLDKTWTDDCVNKVLACAACNGFDNRYMPTVERVCPQSLDVFFDVRDRIFLERKELIRKSHEEELAFFLEQRTQMRQQRA
jgi:hypothetical protein